MKTKPRADWKLSVNLVTADSLLAERLKRYSRKSNRLHIRVSSRPLAGGQFAAFLLPAGDLPDGAAMEALKASGAVVLAFGPAELLRSSFLAGCDDFLKNPWSPEELECRLERPGGPGAQIPESGFRVRFPWGELEVRGFRIETVLGTLSLSYPESRILYTLMRNRGRSVSREVLAYAVWGRPAKAGSRAVDVQVSGLRRKLRRLAPSSRGCIRALRGVGYLID